MTRRQFAAWVVVASMLGILLGLLLSAALDSGDWAEWTDPNLIITTTTER